MELEPPARLKLLYTAGMPPDRAKDEVGPATASLTYDPLDYSSSIILIGETRELHNAAIDRHTGWTREIP